MQTDFAFDLARKFHGDQVDKSGEDYVDGHLRRVYEAVQKYKDSDLEIAAILHDVLEDTDATVPILLDAGVPVNSVIMIETVTKLPSESGNIGYEKFITRVLSSTPYNRLNTIRLKLADINDHLRPLPDEDEPWVATVKRLHPRYNLAKLRLDEYIASQEGF